MNDDLKDPLLLDHDADGIRELDNNLPRWWVWLFHITITFAVGYLLYYHVFHLGNLQIAEYTQEMKTGNSAAAAAMGKFEAGIPKLQPSSDPAILENGRQVYTKFCAPCHRADGGGIVGPNLCDDYWIHGSNFTDSVNIIWNGVPAKGMITWKTTLKPEEVASVASFIYTLRGTHPPNPKPPENKVTAPAGPSFE